LIFSSICWNWRSLAPQARRSIIVRTTLPDVGSTPIRSTTLGFSTPGSPNSASIWAFVIFSTPSLIRRGI
jgi:hypothetical protein